MWWSGFLAATSIQSCYALEITLENPLSSESLLIPGYHWWVGSGEFIRVWQDAWLPRLVTFCPITSLPMVDLDLRVSSLIDEQSHDWNVPLIHSLFWPIDSETILNIPLSRRVVKIELFGITPIIGFSVSSSPQQMEQSWWCFLWKAKIPSKIKVFIWRVCLNPLPNAANLSRRIASASFS
ncbi:UNVERIFIED_CONTAM: hypothetical protein Sradi_4005600 [Sesamum radiatum]|uniref:Reverse transcriptase zinc-binding domain-containing protein n=1 Tax=Sesamum radiatum TaxID=300843 RepID=A0AAW2PKF7_SESRA